MKSFRKVIATTALVVVGSMSVATMASAETIVGTGATFPATFQAKATVDYSIATGHSVSYANPQGSGSGKTAFFNASKQDFAGTDSAVKSTEEALDTNNPKLAWVYVPYVSGAISIAYKLDALNGAALNLSIPTIAGIFDGTIKNWNDPLIVADTVTLTPAALKKAKGKNIEVFVDKVKKSAKSVKVATKGQVAIKLTTKAASTYTVKVDGKEVGKFAQLDTTPTLPSTPITVVVRSGTSGTTNNFIKPLNAFNSKWTVDDSFTKAIPGGVAPTSFQSQATSDAVSNLIAATDGSIGYTEVSFVTDATRAAKGMRSANVKNVAGKFVAPTSAATSSMIADSEIDSKGFVTFNYKQTSNTTAYPFVAITYALGRTAASAKATVVADYLKWILNSFAPLQAEALGYAPLTGAVLTIAKNNAARVGSGN